MIAFWCFQGGKAASRRPWQSSCAKRFLHVYARTYARVVCQTRQTQTGILILIYQQITHTRTYTRMRVVRTIRDSLRIPVGLTTCTRTRARSVLCITPEQCRPRRHQPKYKSNRNTEPKGEPSRVGFGLNFYRKGCSQNGTQGNMVVDDK